MARHNVHGPVRRCTWGCPPLHLFQLRVALDEFFCAPARETDGDAPVFVVAFDADDGADAVTRMASFLAEKRVCIGAASGGRPGKRARAGGSARCGGRLRLTSDTADEFLGRVRILRIGLIPPRLTDLRHGAS